MPIPHLLLALAIIAIWGTNFVVIKIGLEEFPPLLYASLRFAFSCLPWLFLVKRPAQRNPSPSFPCLLPDKDSQNKI